MVIDEDPVIKTVFVGLWLDTWPVQSFQPSKGHDVTEGTSHFDGS